MTAKIFVNGSVFTSDDEQPFANSFISEDGIIIWIGKESEMPEVMGKRIDLQGKRVIPGFVDSHMHPIILADCMDKISCLPPEINSIEELKEAVKERTKVIPNGEWIRGWGYDEEKLDEHRAPNRWDLDEVSKEHPVEILRSCSHIRTVNSKALELAGINRDTPDPQGGEIDRDENGEPTGILRENARHLIDDILPPKSESDIVDSIVILGDLLLSQGVVAFADMGNLEILDYYKYYIKATEKGLKQSVALYYMWDLLKEELTWDEVRKDKRNQVFNAGLKLVGDGSVGGRTAWMERPYKGSKNEFGMSVCSEELIDSAIEFCKENQCQLSFHAMGRKTINRILRKFYDISPWTQDVPCLRLEHFTDPSEEAIQMTAEKGIAVSTQAIFIYSEIESYLNNLGKEWLERTYPMKDMLKAGVKTALSTDAPATSWAIPSDPFPNIKSAVTRYAYDGTECGQKNRIDIEDAIKMYTKEGAEICGFRKIGQLKEGYKANFIVLSEDILNIQKSRIDKVFVEKTYIDGEEVYSKSKIVT
ncbi:MAG: amidohydrolase [Firmicutes bacterium]|nr:amidohydrolase [Bacillota bacterium]